MRQIFKWGNLIMLVAMILVNLMANFLPIGGKTTGEVSANYTTLFTPAPYTFSIWGVIYIMMSIFAIYVAISPVESSAMTEIRNNVGILFMLSCLFNIAWIFCWHNERFGLSVLCIIGLLLTLFLINIRFTTIRPDISIPERISVYGFNIYLGWICAATIANIGVFLKSASISILGFSAPTLTIIALMIVCILGISLSIFGGRFMSSFAILWAIAGIFIKHISRNGFGNAYPLITITLISVFVIISTSIILFPFCNDTPNYYNEMGTPLKYK